MKPVLPGTALILSACLFLAACSGRVATPAGQECVEGLRIANQELEDAKVKGFGASIQWIKAAGLLTDASCAPATREVRKLRRQGTARAHLHKRGRKIRPASPFWQDRQPGVCSPANPRGIMNNLRAV